MDRMIIRGGSRIEGSVQIWGAKNAALPQIAAALLSGERLELTNVPDVTDVDTMLAVMREFGVVASRGSGRVSMPGGCAIGARPIDLHLKALDALGAEVGMESGFIQARTNGDGLR